MQAMTRMCEQLKLKLSAQEFTIMCELSQLPKTLLCELLHVPSVLNT